MIMYYVSHGTTESGDEMPLVVWQSDPGREQLLEYYKDALPDEFEAFGDDFMEQLIRVDEAPLVE